MRITRQELIELLQIAAVALVVAVALGFGEAWFTPAAYWVPAW
jgi:hypothetical protein